jgi:hypothetical protein
MSGYSRNEMMGSLRTTMVKEAKANEGPGESADDTTTAGAGASEDT